MPTRRPSFAAASCADTLAAAAALLRTRCGTEPVLLATHDREAIRLLGWPVIELEAL